MARGTIGFDPAQAGAAVSDSAGSISITLAAESADPSHADFTRPPASRAGSALRPGESLPCVDDSARRLPVFPSTQLRQIQRPRSPLSAILSSSATPPAPSMLRENLPRCLSDAGPIIIGTSHKLELVACNLGTRSGVR